MKNKKDKSLDVLSDTEEMIVLKHESVSAKSTPKPHIKHRPDGLDYVEEKWMRSELNKHYPVWSWVITKSEFLGSEWVVVTGELQVLESGVVRKFGSIGAVRIQFKRGAEHLPQNIIDIDKNVASANTNAFKRAINRLCNISDDVYRKQVEEIELSEEQLKTIETYLNGLDSKITKQVHKTIDSGAVNTNNFDATLRRLGELRQQNNLDEINLDQKQEVDK